MPLAKVQTRFNKKGWGNIIGGILEANDEPDYGLNADDAASEMDDTRRELKSSSRCSQSIPRESGRHLS